MILNALGQFDVSLFLAIDRMHHPNLVTAFFTILHLGTRGMFVYLIPLVALLVSKQCRKSLALILSLGLTELAADVVLKRLFARPRPFQTLQNIFVGAPWPTSFSFPSAEAAVAFAFATFCAVQFKSPYRHWAWAWGLLVAFDRVYLGHHYPGDVLGGALVGMAVTFAAIKLLRAKQLLSA